MNSFKKASTENLFYTDTLNQLNITDTLILIVRISLQDSMPETHLPHTHPPTRMLFREASCFVFFYTKLIVDTRIANLNT